MQYVHEALGHQLTLFTDRTSRTAPELFVKLVPASGHLVSPREAVQLLARIQAALHLPELRLSSIELAADFAVSPYAFERLASWLWVPRIRRIRRVGEIWPTVYFGSRKASRQVKCYWKTGEGPAHARVEFTLRRRALRRMGATAPVDLLELDWPRVAARAGRFVALDITGARQPPLIVGALRDMLLLMGVSLLRTMRWRRRGWMEQRLVPLPVQRNVEAALATLMVPHPSSARSARPGRDRSAGNGTRADHGATRSATQNRNHS